MDDALAVRHAIAKHCRISADRLETEHQEDPSTVVVIVVGAAPLSGGQFDCISRNVTNNVQFAFQDNGQGNRYDGWRQRVTMIDARNDLRRRGLLRKLPRFDARRETLAAFAVRLEKLCGAEPGSTLKAEEDWLRWREMSRDDAKKLHRDQLDREQCALSAAVAVGFDPDAVPKPPLFLPDRTPTQPILVNGA